ncbi:MAG: sigma-70 family RNA polymerase sigma factor [Candidatus Eremiobacteraeota bacterium]|nr:sigma-70 family RNA polymerase sigma factor [Candidatus Eremiobacteraeota bacterium]
MATTFAASRSRADRDRLCEAALPLVRRVAMTVRRRLPQHFSYDDLIGDGCLGLLRAIDRYDPSFGVSFESWAGRIVRGAMLNGLRRMDAIPERVRRDARALEQARWIVAQRTGSSASEREAAQMASLSSTKLDAIRQAGRLATLSIDRPPSGSAGSPISERLPDEQPDPATEASERAFQALVARAITLLPRRERAILEAFYRGGATFGAIGKQLGVSKQRVSQLHGRAIHVLRIKLKALRADA